jgi:hypothetical protein
MNRPKKIAVTLEVANQAQAMELNDAWQEIVSGQKLERAEALEHGVDAVMERARPALAIIETAIRQNPTTGQARRLVAFLAGLYNGHNYPFDLTDLRALDTRLANACLDFLNYDRLGKREVHHHLAGGDRDLNRWIEDIGLDPALRLDDAQAEAFAKLPEQARRDRHELLQEAIEDLLDKYRRKALGVKR